MSLVGRAPRVALIHALPHSIAPINEALARDWPQASRMNLMDDSLSTDLAAGGALDAAMHQRFERLAQYAVDCGSHAILFTCSAFGPCIEAVARKHAPLPVLKPNEAMIADAAAMGLRIGLVATFPPTLDSMRPEFPAHVELECALADGALQALNAGDTQSHDALISQAALKLAHRGCGVIALAQFSMARARSQVAAQTGLPLLTTVDSAVAALRQRVGAA
jgi:Asp/Glu/hydantoin racemase